MLKAGLVGMLMASSLPVQFNAAFAQDTTKAAGETETVEPVAEDPTPAYEAQLLRLAEIVGSLHFLRQLCDGGDAEEWRDRMQELLQAENPSPLRRKTIIARFNRGYRSYSAVYVKCTPSAKEATKLFVNEGQKISDGIVARYGN